MIVNKYIDINSIKIIFLSICFSVQPLLKKKNSSNLTNIESIMITNIIQSFFLIIYYFSFYKQINLSHLKITQLPMCSINVIITIFQSYLFNNLINKNKISTFIPILNSSTGVITTILGYLFLHENIKIYNIFGIITIIFGSYLLYY